MVGLAVDSPTPVREFLASAAGRLCRSDWPGSTAPTWRASSATRSGGLPFTVVFDAGGQLVQRKLGETSYDELAGWAHRSLTDRAA